MLAVIVILFILWLFGALGNVAGGFIHLLLIAILGLVLYRLATDKR